jgi:phytoene dehydrogenase-like protein
MTANVHVVGGGIGGLTAAITAAEHGLTVVLKERSRRLGGRGWTTDGEFKANWGPRVIYSDGSWWEWLQQRGLAEPAARYPMMAPVLIRADGKARRVPPVNTLRALRSLRRLSAPVDSTFIDWATSNVGDVAARRLANFIGVTTYDHDPGRLSAAFVNERLRRATAPRPTVRYIPGGWATLVDRLADHALALGVEIELESPVAELPAGPLIVAVPMKAAAELLGDDTLISTGTRTALLDVGLRTSKLPLIISDFDQPGWIETFSRVDASLAPNGCHLLQAQKGLRPNETLDEGVARIELLLDATIPGWKSKVEWRRRATVEHESGAVDLPGMTWRGRPSIDRGDGRWLVNDMVAAPGLLAEVSVNAAIEAARAVAQSLNVTNSLATSPPDR